MCDYTVYTDSNKYNQWGTSTTTYNNSPYNLSVRWNNGGSKHYSSTGTGYGWGWVTATPTQTHTYQFEKVGDDEYKLTTDFPGYTKKDIEVEVESDGTGFHNIKVEAENESKGKRSWSHKLRKRYKIQSVWIQDGVLVFYIKDDPSIVQKFEVK